MRAGWPSAQYDHSGGGRGGGGAAGVDAPAQVVQASAGEPPVKRPGRCVVAALGQAAAIRSIEAWPRWDDPLSATQNTRRAEAYGSAVITWFTKAVNGAIPVVGSTRPISRARCTS